MAKVERRYFRIVYPDVERPTFAVEGQSFPLVDLSECGMRISDPGKAAPIENAEVLGVIRFSNQETLKVRGRVVRKTEGYAAFELTRGVPYGTIMAEQRRLIRKYKHLILPEDS